MLSARELRDLFVSWITLSVAFAWNLHPQTFLSILPAYALALLTAFIFHELGHKFVAIHLGYHAEYRAWTYGLLFALTVAIVTNGAFVFAAPGAVYVFGAPNRRDDGIISLAGPLMNLIMALITLFIIPVFPHYASLLYFVFRVNAFLGFFNMIPIYPLDGSKILAWSSSVWLAMILALGFLSFGVPALT